MEDLNKEFALQSRVLFIDSSVYHGNNYQFSSKDLESLTRLLNSDQVTLLFTSITIAEVKRHLRAESKEAASAVQSFQQKGKVLRNLPNFSSSIMFERLHFKDVEDELVASFDAFMASKNIEIVSLDLASAENVFEKYFSVLPPFSEKKPNEFRDAFVLSALKAYAINQGVRIHVISNDGDMRDFCSDDPHLFWSDKLGEVINAAVHKERMEPAEFADSAYSAVREDVFSIVNEYLLEQDFGIVESDDADYRQLDFSIRSIESTNKRVFFADRSFAKYGVDFEFDVVVDYLRSAPVVPTASGEFLEVYKCRACYRKVVEVSLELSFYEGDTNSVVIEDWDIVMPGGDNLWEGECVDFLSSKVEAA